MANSFRDTIKDAIIDHFINKWKDFGWVGVPRDTFYETACEMADNIFLELGIDEELQDTPANEVMIGKLKEGVNFT